uniref:Uncharacterized protein n=1 Tax=viral metagenome TaxID=1070528 RepID=A0A6M3JL12_9ZZZZ
MEQVILGSGDCIISGVEMGGVNGICLYQLPNHGYKCDTVPNGIALEDLPQFRIYVKDLKSARLLQDQVSCMVLRMNGYVVANKGE